MTEVYADFMSDAYFPDSLVHDSRCVACWKQAVGLDRRFATDGDGATSSVAQFTPGSHVRSWQRSSVVRVTTRSLSLK